MRAPVLLLGSALLLPILACDSRGGLLDPDKAVGAEGPRPTGNQGRRPRRPKAMAMTDPITPEEDGHPPPQGCRNRPSTVTELSGLVRIEQYKGIQHGRNGDHEIAEGVLMSLKWTTYASRVDTRNVHLAMNVSSGVNPEGLPREIPLKAGQVIEVTGEYIPAENANARNANGDAAVLHFTHSPCGYVVINGQKYE